MSIEKLRKIIAEAVKTSFNEGIFDDGNPDQSWLAGKYSWKTGDGNTEEAEINTKLPYVAIGDYFVQGEEADNTIDQIHQIWLKDDCTPEEAIRKWASFYL